MKILFCGNNVPNQIEQNNKLVSAAGNRFQNNIVENIDKLGHETDNVSYIAVPLSDDEKKSLTKKNTKHKYIWRNGNGIIRRLKSLILFYKEIKQSLKCADLVICYNTFYYNLFLPFLCAQKHVKSILILADYSDTKSYQSAFRKGYALLQKRTIRHYDVVVGLSQTTEMLLRLQQKFVLMEGGIEQQLFDSFAYKEHADQTPVVFMYAGLLSKVTGIDLLLKSMEEIQSTSKDIKLIISGKGDLEQQVKAAAAADERIVYLGHLPYGDYVQALQNADILMNPRNMKLPENQNNFPSKIMDYLAAGKMILSTRFVGWEKFSEYVSFMEQDEITTAMEEATKNLLHHKDTNTIQNEYKTRRNFAEKLLWQNQIKKIIDG